jgi:hypothetical protein
VGDEEGPVPNGGRKLFCSGGKWRLDIGRGNGERVAEGKKLIGGCRGFSCRFHLPFTSFLFFCLLLIFDNSRVIYLYLII